MNARRWSDSGAYKLDDQRDDDYGDCGHRRSRKAMSESPVDDDYCATRIVVDEDEPEIGTYVCFFFIFDFSVGRHETRVVGFVDITSSSLTLTTTTTMIMMMILEESINQSITLFFSNNAIMQYKKRHGR